jgi:hypothetical protein
LTAPGGVKVSMANRSLRINGGESVTSGNFLAALLARNVGRCSARKRSKQSQCNENAGIKSKRQANKETTAC